MAPRKTVRKTKEEKRDDVGSVEDFALIDGFELADPNKLERVIYGQVGNGGGMEGGLGVNADPKDVIAEYDRIGGLIRKDGIKIKTGSFFDFDRRVKAPRKTPQVIYQFYINGETLELSDPAELPKIMAERAQADIERQADFKTKKAGSKFKETPAI